MNIGLILASGEGSRVKGSNVPKQFIEINKKPIVIHTIEKFLFNPNIDKLVVVCHPDWIDFLEKKVNDKKIYVVKGGKTRNESICNGLLFLKNNLKVTSNDIIITHDAVRMFVSDRIINDNIKMCQKVGVVDTVVPSTDTIIESLNKKEISNIPNRNNLFNGQTPQTFKFEIIYEAYKENNEDTSDACSLVLKKSISPIALVIGDYENIKITTDFDLKYAKGVIENND